MASQWVLVDLFTADVAAASVRTSQDNYQFVWVDGRENAPARRVIINSENEIIAGQIGVDRPLEPPEMVAAKFDEEDAQGTYIPKGAVLLVCYTYINSEEEESNPSPVLAIDTMQEISRGYWLKDDVIYHYPIDEGVYTGDTELHGSIVSFSLNIPIEGSNVRRVNIYAAYANGVEGESPATRMLLINSVRVYSGETDRLVKVASPMSAVAVSYVGDKSPAGDDIQIVNGTIFVANSVANLGLPLMPEKVWAITLRNNNPLNYVNRWFAIDLYDESEYRPEITDYLHGLNWDEISSMALLRMFDNDLTTPLEVYHYPKDAVLKNLESVSTGDMENAVLGVGTPASDNFVRFSFPGVAGNDITIQYIIGPQIASVMVDDPADEETEIVWVSEPGLGQLSVQYINPGGTSALAITHVAGVITVSLQVAGGVVTCDVDDLLAKIATEMETGGALEGVIASAEAGGAAVGSTMLVAMAAAQYFVKTPLSVDIESDTDLKIYLAYDSETDSVQTRAINVKNICNDLLFPALGEKMTADNYGNLGPAMGVVEAFSPAESMSGGVGEPVLQTDEIQTRLYCHIRIPLIEAFAEKTIYLAKFAGDPSPHYANEFVKLVAGTAGTGELSLSDFYGTKVIPNPVRHEQDIIATSPVLIPYIGGGADTLNDDNKALIWNKANTSFFELPAEGVPEISEEAGEDGLDVLDNYALAQTADAYGAPLFKRPIWANLASAKVELYDHTRQDFPPEIYGSQRKGTLIISTKLPEDGWSPDELVPEAHYGLAWLLNLFSTEGEPGVDGYVEFRFSLHWIKHYEKLVLHVYSQRYVDGDYKFYDNCIQLLLPSALYAKSVTIALSWEQIKSAETVEDSGIDIHLAAISPGGYAATHQIVADKIPDLGNFYIGTPPAIFYGSFTEPDPGGKSLDIYWSWNDSAGEFRGYHTILVPADKCVEYHENGNYAYMWPLRRPSCIYMRREVMDIGYYALRQMARNMPLFPVEGVGCYDEYDMDEAEALIYHRNIGVTFNSVNVEADTTPGRIQWGSYGQMPSLNEVNINEEIVKIHPLKSLMPTDEHNTILIWTKKRLYRMPLLGADASYCRPIVEGFGYGMDNADAFAETEGGVAWANENGVYAMTGGGIDRVSHRKIDPGVVASILYDRIKRQIWVVNATTTYIYDITAGVWSTTNETPPYISAEMGGKQYKIVPESDGDWLEVDAGDDAETKIVTGALAAMPKINRITLISDEYGQGVLHYTGGEGDPPEGREVEIKATVYSHRNGAEGALSSTTTIKAVSNVPIAIPGLSGDYVVLEITSLVDLLAIQIERPGDRNG